MSYPPQGRPPYGPPPQGPMPGQYGRPPVRRRPRKWQISPPLGILLALGLVGFGAVLGGAVASAAKDKTAATAAGGAVASSTKKVSAPSSHAPLASKPAGASIGAGTWRVPQDVKPGTYRTAGPAPGSFGSCYWARLKGLGGSMDDITANGSPQGPTTVTISSRDKGFETEGCKKWTKV